MACGPQGMWLSKLPQPAREEQVTLGWTWAESPPVTAMLCDRSGGSQVTGFSQHRTGQSGDDTGRCHYYRNPGGSQDFNRGSLESVLFHCIKGNPPGWPILCLRTKLGVLAVCTPPFLSFEVADAIHLLMALCLFLFPAQLIPGCSVGMV